MQSPLLGKEVAAAKIETVEVVKTDPRTGNERRKEIGRGLVRGTENEKGNEKWREGGKSEVRVGARVGVQSGLIGCVAAEIEETGVRRRFTRREKWRMRRRRGRGQRGRQQKRRRVIR